MPLPLEIVTLIAKAALDTALNEANASQSPRDLKDHLKTYRALAIGFAGIHTALLESVDRTLAAHTKETEHELLCSRLKHSSTADTKGHGCERSAEARKVERARLGELQKHQMRLDDLRRLLACLIDKKDLRLDN